MIVLAVAFLSWALRSFSSSALLFKLLLHIISVRFTLAESLLAWVSEECLVLHLYSSRRTAHQLCEAESQVSSRNSWLSARPLLTGLTTVWHFISSLLPSNGEFQWPFSSFLVVSFLSVSSF